MKTVSVILCVVAAAAAVPLNFNQGGTATGSAAGNVVSGTTNTGGQSSQITQVSASAGVSLPTEVEWEDRICEAKSPDARGMDLF